MFHLQTNPSLIELVKGYGVNCTQRQLNNEEANSVDLPQKSLFMDTFIHRRKTRDPATMAT